MSDLQAIIQIRPARFSDRSYCLKTWLSSYSHSPVARALGANYYRAWSGVVEEQYLKSQVLVACLVDDPDSVVGFIVIGPQGGSGERRYDYAIHYLAVRERWRNQGIAKLLLGDLIQQIKVAYTHTPPPELKDKIPPTWFYEPTLTHRWIDD